MPLYIRDDNVSDLALEAMRLTGAKTKTEVVRDALLATIQAKKNEKPIMELIRELQDDLNRELGPPDPDFDMKAYADAEEDF